MFFICVIIFSIIAKSLQIGKIEVYDFEVSYATDLVIDSFYITFSLDTALLPVINNNNKKKKNI